MKYNVGTSGKKEVDNNAYFDIKLQVSQMHCYTFVYDAVVL